MSFVFVIAEAGVNHNGEPDKAFALIDSAVAAGADAVKFQTFIPEQLVSQTAVKANYQQRSTGADESQYAMLKRLALPHALHHQLQSYCQQQGILFLSTAFDLTSLKFLVDELRLEQLKLPSGEINNAPLLWAHARTGKNILMSTGMASLGDIEAALGVLACGYLGKKPSRQAFAQAFNSEAGQSLLREKVQLLHCTTEYPAPVAEVNLNVIPTLATSFGLPCGYSDHTDGISVPIAAVALGARVIEKHFTLNKNLPGPDHKASLEPEELKAMVDAIRITEQALGQGQKRLQASEVANRDVARKSMMAAQAIAKGDIFSENNLICKRPGTGRSPLDYYDILGTSSPRDYAAEDLID